jgi:hypothetical protein
MAADARRRHIARRRVAADARALAVARWAIAREYGRRAVGLPYTAYSMSFLICHRRVGVNGVAATPRPAWIEKLRFWRECTNPTHTTFIHTGGSPYDRAR